MVYSIYYKIKKLKKPDLIRNGIQHLLSNINKQKLTRLEMVYSIYYKIKKIKKPDLIRNGIQHLL